MKDVVRISDRRSPAVAVLRELLAEAEAGKVRAIVFAADMEDETVQSGIAFGSFDRSWSNFALHYGASQLPGLVLKWAAADDEDA